MMRHWGLICAFTVAACDQELSVGRRLVVEDRWVQSISDQVDVLWVIDNSNSMLAETRLLGRGSREFGDQLVNSAVDYQLGVVTTTMDSTFGDAGILIGDPPVLSPANDIAEQFATRASTEVYDAPASGFERGLEAAAFAVGAGLADHRNRAFLRPDANLVVVFVSDEDDCSHGGMIDQRRESQTTCDEDDRLRPVDDWVDEIVLSKSTPDLVQLSAIVGRADSSCEADPGGRYVDAARQTGGVVGDLCERDWSGVLEALGLASVGRRRVFELSLRPLVSSLSVSIDDTVVSETLGGWSYDPDDNVVRFEEASRPLPGAVVVARYRTR